MELYLEVLDKVKYLLEDIVKTGPVVMLGDMTTNVPQNQQIAITSISYAIFQTKCNFVRAAL